MPTNENPIMADQECFAERVVRVEPTGHHYSLLVADDGGLLAVDADGHVQTSGVGDDSTIWEASSGGYRHAVSERELPVAADGSVSFDGRRFAPCHGPEQLPSQYLQTLRREGWVCLTTVLPPAVVVELQRVACTDDYAAREPDRTTPQFSQSAALARTAAEPVSLWVVRQYLATPDIRFAHTPALIVLTQDDGKRNVQGWHSDYPYHWGIRAPGRVPELPASVILGVQRNVCVSDFTKERGATAFKLGSHVKNQGPPEEWGTATAHAKPNFRAENGLPYNGPDADIVEAPAGSIILYDSRTWHRAGVNRTSRKRAAMLQAMTPMFVMPKNDTSQAYKHFVQSPIVNELTQRERDELQQLMVHRFLGPVGRNVITADAELTAMLG